MINMTNNYGITHGLITGGVLLVALLLFPTAVAPISLALCGYWMFRETQGPGNLWGYPKNYTGQYTDWDRRMDWITPILVSIVFIILSYIL